MNPKPWWQSRTIWAAVIVVLLAGWEAAITAGAKLPAIPVWLIPALTGAGLYTARTAATAIKVALLALLLCSASPASAQQAISLTDIGQRIHVTANAGAMVQTSGKDWSGASIGGTAVYNLHPKLSLVGGYDHGIPVNELDRPKDFWRVFGSLRVHPNAFFGFGYGWFGDGVDGGLAQLAIYKPVMPRLDLAASYSHVFADGSLDDFEYVKVVLNYHLIGKE